MNFPRGVRSSNFGFSGSSGPRDLTPQTLSAQVRAELKMRLRSFATPVALLVFLVGAFLWIPDPKGRSATLTWELADGRIQSPIYTVGYVGLAVAILSCIFLTLGGFYLVAGSVRRDRDSKVGAILAATPLSKTAYLGGKLAAHVAYLFVLSLLALVSGVVAFLRFGVGPFSLVDFAAPYLVLTLPAIVAVASIAVFFDVTPGLRSRGGLVLWFFVFAFGLVMLPLTLSSDSFQKPGARLPVFDPAGIASDAWLVRRSLPEGVKNISSGHVTHAKPPERVPWKGLAITPLLLGLRVFNVALCAIPLALAVLIFDRFDPSRGRRRVKKSGLFARLKTRFRPTALVDATGGADLARGVRLTPVEPRPSAARAVAAEARLIWESASWIRWPLALAALLAGLLPGNVAPGIFLVLLIPVISEVAAREDLAGTRALVFSQPGVPRSAVLWKAASLALFLLALGTPLAIRCFVASPVRGLACIAGLLAIAGVAVGFGSLTRGGKLFSGLYVAVWYTAMSGMAGADFTGALAKAPVPLYSLAYLGLGIVLAGAAMAGERLRTT